MQGAENNACARVSFPETLPPVLRSMSPTVSAFVAPPAWLAVAGASTANSTATTNAALREMA
jgi:hypothetical protein